MVDAVLVFEQARLPAAGGAHGTLAVDVAVEPAELVLIDTREEWHETCLAEAIGGFASPVTGKVRFLGHDWTGLPRDYADALRGRIGRAPEDDGWVPHLAMPENICLPQLHHTQRSLDALCGAAAALAVQFGLPGLPSGLPSDLTELDRSRAALVRAFLGSPALILLGHPRRAPVDLIGPLVNAVRNARERDAAVMWFIGPQDSWNDDSIPATRRLFVRGGAVVEEGR